MKALKPSHREHKRYLFIAGKNAVKGDIEKAILDFTGILGYAEASPSIIKQTKEGIVISINRESLEKLKSSFLLSGKDIQVKRVSGTIKGLMLKNTP